jgi:release factor glutamine methyltransferase
VLDVGTGSGAVALAIATELDGCAVTATDTSPGALALARENAEALGLADRVRLAHGSVPPGERYDLVVANLPYVAEGEWRELAPEIREWEPRDALLAGADGLDAIRSLLAARPDCAALALEVGAGQAPTVAGMVAAAGWPRTEVRRDLAGIERVVVGRRAG